MCSFREYCEKMSTEQLKALLREEYEGRGSLPRLAILDICDALSGRDAGKPNLNQLLRQLCGLYLED